MDFEKVYLGASPNDETGDPPRTAYGKINDNFDLVSDALDDITGSQTDGYIVDKTWPLLSGHDTTPWTEGQGAQVLGPDAGTHTDPVTGATGVTNLGVYRLTKVAIAARATATFTANPAANDTITPNGHAITFVTGTPTGAQVQIGANAAATAAALQAYIAANAATLGVSATVSSNMVTIFAGTPGLAGNSITLTKSSAGITLSGATLSGGLGAGFERIADLPAAAAGASATAAAASAAAALASANNAAAAAATAVTNLVGYLTTTIRKMGVELAASGWRFRVGNRLYATFDATLGFYFRKLRLTQNATVDDNTNLTLGQRLLASAVGAYFKGLTGEGSGGLLVRLRIKNRVYATVDAARGIYIRKLIIPATTKVDDDLTSNIVSRLVASGLGSYFAKLGPESGGVLRFRWGHRLIGQWTRAGGMYFTRMTLPADVKLADLPTTNLTDRLGGSGGTASANANWVAVSSVDSGGKFQISTHRRSDGLRVQLTSGLTSYRAPFVTPDDKVLFYSDADARQMYAPASGGAINPVNPYNILAAYGDSLTAGAGSANNGSFPSQLSILLGSAVTAVNNRGVGGQTSIEIEARDGGAPSLLTFPSNQIPASGSVSVSSWSVSFITSQGPAGGAMTGYVLDTSGNKIAGTVTATAFDGGGRATAMNFARTTPGSVANIASGGTGFITDLGVSDRNSVKLFTYGRNNLNFLSQILASLLAGVGYQTPYTPRFLVGSILMAISTLDTEATRATIAADNAAIQATYPQNYVDLNAPPTVSEMASIGYTPDYAVFLVPGTNTPTGRTDAADLVGAATGMLTFSGNPAANDTVTINGRTVTFVTGTPGANQVQIGADAVTTTNNLVTYINANTGGFACGAKAVQVSGVAYVILTATAAGTGGNSLALAASSSVIVVSGSTFAGGSAYGVIPSGMRSAAAITTADYLHLNNYGYALWALRYYRAIVAKGWFPTLAVI